MTPTVLRFGVIGTGYWAEHAHAAALSGSHGAAVTAVWGRDRQKAAQLGERIGARSYEDFDDLLAEVDAVAIAVSPDAQPDLAVRAARAGRHLFLEKPLALDVAEAQAIVDAVDKAGVASVIFFTGRFLPELEQWFQNMAEIGPWHSAHLINYGNNRQPGSPYAASPWRHQYGALWDVGPHALSFMQPLVGSVTSVAARSGPSGTDTVHLLLTHAPQLSEPISATSVLSMSSAMPPAASIRQLTLCGERGVRVWPDVPWSFVEAGRQAISELTTMALTGETRHRCDVHFGLETVKVLAAAEQAIDLPGPPLALL